jgi:hypothetical protein
MKKGSYPDHLIVFDNTVNFDPISGTKSPMRRIGECEKKKTGDPKNKMSFHHCQFFAVCITILRLSVAGKTSNLDF